MSDYDDAPGRNPQALEPIDDLIAPEDEAEEQHHRARNTSSVREIASRIPESLSAIGRDISRTIERAISAKDDYVVAVKVSHEAQDKLEQLVQAGVLRAVAEDARLHELFQFVLRLVRDLDGDDVVVLGRDGALNRAADVAADGAQRLWDARGDLAHGRGVARPVVLLFGLVLGGNQVVYGLKRLRVAPGGVVVITHRLLNSFAKLWAF